MMTPGMKEAAPDLDSEILDILSNINAAVTNTRLYSPNHPHVQRHVEETYLLLNHYLLGWPELTLLFMGEELIFNQHPIRIRGTRTAVILRNFRLHGIERVTFSRGVGRGDLFRFIAELADPDAEAVHGSEFIRLGKLQINVDETVAGRPALTAEQSDRLDRMNAAQEVNLQGIKELYGGITQMKKVDIRGIDQIVHSFVRGLSIGLNPITMLAPIRSADEYTFTHVVNVCILTMSQAESLGIKGRELYHIGVASLLHDTGKLFIPLEILNKPGKLTTDERQIIETHPIQGAQYIMRLNGIPKLAVLGALEHHIRFDGGGYPRLSKRWHPNMVSQLITISDVFDAMRSRRAYKEPKADKEIIRILEKESGTTFNPFLVDNFIRLIKEERRTPVIIPEYGRTLEPVR